MSTFKHLTPYFDFLGHISMDDADNGSLTVDKYLRENNHINANQSVLGMYVEGDKTIPLDNIDFLAVRFYIFNGTRTDFVNQGKPQNLLIEKNIPMDFNTFFSMFKSVSLTVSLRDGNGAIFDNVNGFVF